MKKYMEQFEAEKQERSYIEEQRYVHTSTHKEKERPKKKQQQVDKGGLNAQSEYYHNSRVGQTAKLDNDKNYLLSLQVSKKN